MVTNCALLRFSQAHTAISTTELCLNHIQNIAAWFLFTFCTAYKLFWRLLGCETLFEEQLCFLLLHQRWKTRLDKAVCLKRTFIPFIGIWVFNSKGSLPACCKITWNLPVSVAYVYLTCTFMHWQDIKQPLFLIFDLFGMPPIGFSCVCIFFPCTFIVHTWHAVDFY